MKRTIIAIILAGLLLLMMPTAVVSAAGVSITSKTGDGLWDGDTWQVEIYPGGTKSTTLTLYNSSSSSLEVEIPLPDSLDNDNLTFELDKTNFTMSGRSYTDVTLTLKASGSATPGTYTAELLEIKSEVPPRRPSRPRPSEVAEPEEEEPAVEEPEITEPEPTVPEPEKSVEEPVVEEPEPEKPEVEEPTVEEPIAEEPEVIEPDIEEPETVMPDIIVPKKASYLWAYILAGVLATGGLFWVWWKRRRNKNNE